MDNLEAEILSGLILTKIVENFQLDEISNNLELFSDSLAEAIVEYLDQRDGDSSESISI